MISAYLKAYNEDIEEEEPEELCLFLNDTLEHSLSEGDNQADENTLNSQVTFCVN